MTTDSVSTNPSATRELSLLTVREMVADCLALEVDEVTPQARFFEDLGGESIDLIQLTFEFEKGFNIRAPYKAFTNKDVWERDESGELTAAAREIMRRDFGSLDIERRLADAATTNPRIADDQTDVPDAAARERKAVA